MSQNTEEKTAPNAARRRALRITERDALGRVLPGSINVNGGRPKGATVTTLARTYTDRAIELLGAVMEDERSPQAARVTAAQALLDRGWGKAPIQIDLNVRAKFDDFLRDVGVLADNQRDQGLVIEAGVEAVRALNLQDARWLLWAQWGFHSIQYGPVKVKVSN